jgi:hypothetical protein
LVKENGILESYFLAGNMHYIGEKTVCHYGKIALVAKEGDTKFTFHDAENLQLNLQTFRD